MKTKLLGNEFAVEIEGVDLASLDNAGLDELRNVWMRHKVAVLRDQKLSDDALITFTRRLGPLFVHVRDQYHHEAHPEIMYISNLKEDGRDLGSLGNGELRWHSDQSYTPRPVHGTLLYGVEIPKNGGATWFCDLVAAYAAMPAKLRNEIEGETACYSGLKPESSKRSPYRPDQVDGIPDQRHPMVRTHPYLEHEALHISPNHITQIDEMDLEETEEGSAGWSIGPNGRASPTVTNGGSATSYSGTTPRSCTAAMAFRPSSAAS